jgi:hypothetical protein
MEKGKYAIVEYQGLKVKGKLDLNETKLFNTKKKTLFLSLGSDTKILKRFTTKVEMEKY